MLVTRTSHPWRLGEGLGLCLGQEDSARGREGTPFPPSPSAAEQAIADVVNRKEIVVGRCGGLRNIMDSQRRRQASQAAAVSAGAWSSAAQVVWARCHSGSLGQPLPSGRCSVVLGSLMRGKLLHAAGNLLKACLLLLQSSL